MLGRSKGVGVAEQRGSAITHSWEWYMSSLSTCIHGSGRVRFHILISSCYVILPFSSAGAAPSPSISMDSEVLESPYHYSAPPTASQLSRGWRQTPGGGAGAPLDKPATMQLLVRGWAGRLGI